MAARLLDLFRRRMDRPGQFGMRLAVLRRNCHIRPVARSAQWMAGPIPRDPPR